jgi:hypothetical protein
MLGILLSESAEILYSIIKLTYDASKGVYYWYYEMEEPEQKKIHELEERIINLEKTIKNDKQLQNSKEVL